MGKMGHWKTPLTFTILVNGLYFYLFKFPISPPLPIAGHFSYICQLTYLYNPVFTPDRLCCFYGVAIVGVANEKVNAVVDVGRMMAKQQVANIAL